MTGLDAWPPQRAVSMVPERDPHPAQPALLTLTLQGPARLMGAARSKTLRTGSLLIGRSPVCDWVLPDPDRVVSGRHCRIDCEGSRFILTDLSTNGVFPGEGVEPLGMGGTTELRDGQRLRLGDAVLLVALSSETAPAPATLPAAPEAKPALIADDWFAPNEAKLSADPMPLPVTMPSSEFADLLAAELAQPFAPTIAPPASFAAAFGDLTLSQVLAALDEATAHWQPDQLRHLRRDMDAALARRSERPRTSERDEADRA